MIYWIYIKICELWKFVSWESVVSEKLTAELSWDPQSLLGQQEGVGDCVAASVFLFILQDYKFFLCLLCFDDC